MICDIFEKEQKITADIKYNLSLLEYRIFPYGISMLGYNRYNSSNYFSMQISIDFTAFYYKYKNELIYVSNIKILEKMLFICNFIFNNTTGLYSCERMLNIAKELREIIETFDKNDYIEINIDSDDDIDKEKYD